MGLQVTASKVGLLLECQRPFDETVTLDHEEVSEAADCGTRFHEAMHGVLFKQTFAPTELEQHVAAALKCLTAWLHGGNEWGAKFSIEYGERALGENPHSPLDPVEIGFDAEAHRYDAAPNWISGAPDLVAKSDVATAVVDYKTGEREDYSNPKTPQMLTLALLTGANIVAILHTPKDGIPVVYASVVTEEEKAFHREAIQAAMARIGDGSMRPGSHCDRLYCPTRGSCPTQVGGLLVRTEALARVAPSSLLEADPGRLHMLLADFEKLAKLAKAEIKERVRAGEVIERPDGKVLTLVSKKVSGYTVEAREQEELRAVKP